MIKVIIFITNFFNQIEKLYPNFDQKNNNGEIIENDEQKTESDAKNQMDYHQKVHLKNRCNFKKQRVSSILSEILSFDMSNEAEKANGKVLSR